MAEDLIRILRQAIETAGLEGKDSVLISRDDAEAILRMLSGEEEAPWTPVGKDGRVRKKLPGGPPGRQGVFREVAVPYLVCRLSFLPPGDCTDRQVLAIAPGNHAPYRPCGEGCFRISPASSAKVSGMPDGISTPATMTFRHHCAVKFVEIQGISVSADPSSRYP